MRSGWVRRGGCEEGRVRGGEGARSEWGECREGVRSEWGECREGVRTEGVRSEWSEEGGCEGV